MIPSQEIRLVASKFGVQIKRMEKIQNGVYHIVTAKGQEYCLKRMPYPLVRLRWIDKTLQNMRRISSIRIGWRNPRHRLGKRLYVKSHRESPPFVLIPWLRGSWPSPRSNKQMRACGTLLAQFHQAGHKIQITKSGRHNMMGKWPSDLLKEQNTLRKNIRRAKGNGFRSPLDRLLQQHGNEILQMASVSIRQLRNSSYLSICRKRKATLCHGDFGPTNIIRTKKGMYLIDFETLRLDIRAYDLYRLIYNCCHIHDWKFATAKSILDGYQKIHKLKKSDFQMLKILLRFPRGMCKLIQQYAQSTNHNLQIEREFAKVLTDERRRSEFLKKLDIYAGR